MLAVDRSAWLVVHEVASARSARLSSTGMGQGPALALLLAGPALSLPNMLVIRSVLGTKKTVAYITLVVIMATISGMIFGHFF